MSWMNQNTTTAKMTMASSVPAPTDRMRSASDMVLPPGCQGSAGTPSIFVPIRRKSLMHTLARAALAAIALILSFAAWSEGTAPPLDLFLKRIEFSDFSLSPSGRYLGAISPVKGRYNLAVVDLEKRSLNRITSFEDSDVLAFQWIADDRLSFGVGDAQEASGRRIFRGRYLINADATQPTRVDQKIPGFTVVSTVTDQKDEIIISANLRMQDYEDLYRYNIRNGKTSLITYDSPGQVISWVMDRNHVPRVAVSRVEGKTTIWYRPDEKTPWARFWDGIDDQDHARPIA